jgi:hypothetical protein
MKEGDKEEDVDINIEMPPSIVKDILHNSRKRKADGSVDCRPCKVHNPPQGKCSNATPSEGPGDVEGDTPTKLEQYCPYHTVGIGINSHVSVCTTVVVRSD